MLLLKLLAPLALAVGLVAAAPASGAPPARSAGGDVVALTYPSIVNVRLVQAQKALDRAIYYEGDAQPNKAAASLKVARTNMSKAWLGAKYVIEHAPPPVAGDDGFAYASGGAPVAGTVAGPEDTAFAVLTLQHQVATTAIGLSDTAKGALLSTVSTTIFAAMNQRDAAIKYIHALPAPPATDDSIDAGASGAEVVASWATVMPNAIPLLDDEIQQINGMQDDRSLSSGARRILNAAELQATKTEKTINQWWPPLPADD
jgi:hypothetical protein